MLCVTFTGRRQLEKVSSAYVMPFKEPSFLFCHAPILPWLVALAEVVRGRLTPLDSVESVQRDKLTQLSRPSSNTLQLILFLFQRDSNDNVVENCPMSATAFVDDRICHVGSSITA